VDPIRTLFELAPLASAPVLPDDLRSLYGGDLRFPLAPPARPYIFANFVSTLDGVVTFEIPGKAGGSEISGSNEPDRFIMGLLRAAADAVILGSATVQAVPSRHLWVAESICPPAKDAYLHYRRNILRKPQYPLTVIVTSAGRLDLSRAIFHTPGIRVLVLTTESGRDLLQAGGASGLPSTEIRALPSAQGRIHPASITDVLKKDFGIDWLLHEGGPTLFGEFVAARMVDELFLTLAPQIAGRIPSRARPGLVSGCEFVPGNAPWFTLAAVKQHASHLFLRYTAPSQ
jgi:riboflavin biosynthesis pyrimidine reductase